MATVCYDGDWLLAGRVGIDSRQGYFSPHLLPDQWYTRGEVVVA